MVEPLAVMVVTPHSDLLHPALAARAQQRPVPTKSTWAGVQQRPAETARASARNMTAQVSNVEIGEQAPARLSAKQVVDIVARYAPIARRTEGMTTGDVAAGLRYELASLSDARKSAMSRLFPDE